MKLKGVAIELLNQLLNTIRSMEDQAYAKPLPILSQASIGKHIRHVMEFCDCMERSRADGKLCYDKRQRELRLEEDRAYMIDRIERHILWLGQVSNDYPIQLDVEYAQSGVRQEIRSSFLRELAYNIEHLVHHMAIIKIGMNVEFPHVALPIGFGVAQSTQIHYQK